VSNDEIEALSPELRALLDREAGAHSADPALESAVLARVERAVALHGPTGGGDGGASDGSPPAGDSAAPGGGTPGPGTGLAIGAVKAISTKAALAIASAAFIGGAIVGGSVVSSTTTPVPRVSPSSPSASSAPSTATTSTTVDVGPVASASAPPLLAASVPAAPSVPRRSPGESAGDLTRERELLDVARAALGHGDPAGAIAAARRHEESFPRGLLVEEREVVWIQALARSGQTEAAKRKAAAFRGAHRNSVLLPVVEAAVSAREKDAEP